MAIELAGDWSSDWYNGYICESDISRGLMVWKLKDRRVEDAKKLDRLNPQTQEFTIESKPKDDDDD